MNEFNTVYWFKDPSADGKNKTVSSGSPEFGPSLLQEMSERGFNVYKTVNTFVGNGRKQEDLAEIRACFVDIDYPELADRGFTETGKKERGKFLNEKFRNEVHPSLLVIRSRYGIYPSEFNVTNKGFHILFAYDPECHFITPELHAKMNAILGDALGGDRNARDVSRVYRVAGYADWKGGYHGKIKALKLEHPEARISKETIETKFCLAFEERDSRKIISALETQKEKSAKREMNRKKIDSIDAREFVGSVADYIRSTVSFKNPPYPLANAEKVLRLLTVREKPGSDHFVFCEEDGSTPTSGLSMEAVEGTYSICDYSRKTRVGNLNFLKNWIVPALGVAKEEEWKHINVILHSSVGIGLHSLQEKHVPMNAKLLTDYFQGRVRFGGADQRVLAEKNPLGNIIRIPSMAKAYFAIFSFVFDRITESSKIPWDKTENGYFVAYSDLFDFAFPEMDTPSKRKHHKKPLAGLLARLSDMEVLFDDGSGPVWKKIVSVRFPSLSLHKGQKDGFFLVPLQERIFRFGGSRAYFDLRALSLESGFLETGITDLLLYASAMTSNGRRDFTLRTDYATEFLGLSGTAKSRENTLRRHFSKAVSAGILGSYSLAGGRITLSKRKGTPTESKAKRRKTITK